MSCVPEPEHACAALNSAVQGLPLVNVELWSKLARAAAVSATSASFTRPAVHSVLPGTGHPALMRILGPLHADSLTIH